MDTEEGSTKYYPKKSWVIETASKIFKIAVLLIGYRVCQTLVFLLAIIQFLYSSAKGTPLSSVQNFSQTLAIWNAQAIKYCLGHYDASAPFPFKSWPSNEDGLSS